jgi:hypothetical protein
MGAAAHLDKDGRHTGSPHNRGVHEGQEAALAVHPYSEVAHSEFENQVQASSC